jgi:SAM-dependent methyltransferase
LWRLSQHMNALGEMNALRADDISYERMIVRKAPLSSAPSPIPLRSQICRKADFALDAYRFWCAQIHEVPRLHRKQWEFFYICQALHERGLLRPGSRGLGFGVGREPLPAMFAAWGVDIVATDQAAEGAQRAGWRQSGQHAGELEALRRPEICDDASFRQRVRFRVVDMNDVARDLDDFDFCWSACCFEHLGSLEHGLRFVEESIRTLRLGGVAIHTTEFNLTSQDRTLESPGLSVYRQKDIASLVGRLEAAGHSVEPVDWAPGGGIADDYVDLPPYKSEPHLKLRLATFDCTSIGLIITRSGGPGLVGGV